MKALTIWTPINAESGFGHFYRQYGLYEKLLQDNYSVNYFTNKKFIPLEKTNILSLETEDIYKIISFLQKNLIKIILIDNYKVSHSNLEILKQHFKIIYFDYDFQNPKVDVIINFNPFSKDKYKNKHIKTKYFLGLEHMTFRKKLEIAKHNSLKKNEIFISIGGSDLKNITYKLIPFLPTSMHYNIVLGQGCSSDYYDAVLRQLNNFKLRYSLYQQPNNYFDILTKSQYAIISCSTSAYEMFYFSKSFICINVVKNQNTLTDYLNNQNIMTISHKDINKITDIISSSSFANPQIQNNYIESDDFYHYLQRLLI